MRDVSFMKNTIFLRKSNENCLNNEIEILSNRNAAGRKYEAKTAI